MRGWGLVGALSGVSEQHELTLTPPFCAGCVFPSERSAVSTQRETRNVQSRSRHGSLQVDMSISCRTDMLDVFVRML